MLMKSDLKRDRVMKRSAKWFTTPVSVTQINMGRQTSTPPPSRELLAQDPSYDSRLVTEGGSGEIARL